MGSLGLVGSLVLVGILSLVGTLGLCGHSSSLLALLVFVGTLGLVFVGTLGLVFVGTLGLVFVGTLGLVFVGTLGLCAFPCLPLCLSLPAFVRFLACLCTFLSLPLYVFALKNGAPRVMTKYKDKPYTYELQPEYAAGEKIFPCVKAMD